MAREPLNVDVLSAALNDGRGGKGGGGDALFETGPSAKDIALQRAKEQARRLASAAAAVTVNSVMVEWDAPPATMHFATTMEAVAVRYRAIAKGEDEPWTSLEVDLLEQQRAEKPNSVMVTGLEVGTAYEFVLATRNAFGWSPNSNALEVTTKDSWQDNESFL